MSQFHLTRSDFPSVLASTKAAAVAAAATKPEPVAKVGARFNKADMALVQDSHDAMAKLADGVHCAAMMANDKDAKDGKDGKGKDKTGDGAAEGDTEKAGARHNKGDMEDIGKAHDIMCTFGAKCAS